MSDSAEQLNRALARTQDDGSRSAVRLLKSQQAALTVLDAASSGLDTPSGLPEFFGRLTRTVAGLVGAGRVAFWRLGSDELLTIQPEPFGFEAHARIKSIGGVGLELAADGDRVLDGADPRGMPDSIAVSWRPSDRVIGTLAAYDSEDGFTRDDVWVLGVAARATALIWRFKETADQLGTTHERLHEAALARRSLLNNVASGGDEARRRFAAQLHDDSLQLLTAAELQLERIRAGADGTSQAARLDELHSTIRAVEDSLRGLLVRVRPVVLDSPLGLAETIRDRVELLRTHTGIEPSVDVRLPNELPALTGSIVFRTLSEALANVEKHAFATRLRVTCEAIDGGVRVEVVDDGTGFVVAERVPLPGHVGLVAMTERVRLNGGWFRIESEPGAGTRLEFWVPTAI